MIPAPGVAVVTLVETEETYQGGRIVVPDQTRAQWTRCQAEVVAVGEPGFCDEDDCEREHCATYAEFLQGGISRHPVPNEIAEGAWIILPPRALLPSESDSQFYVAIDDIWAVLR